MEILQEFEVSLKSDKYQALYLRHFTLMIMFTEFFSEL
jgi:hypothetical protein